ncbi:MULTISPECIES: 1-acyl-sn-glycerol-3-phosphate acyltransferase [Marinobacter]|uniref:1-acyl-sn-glycerol-3-phosphate acyltransferase n=1 Tax=Marinobacter xiaoshiensis TaxID=3073652 RepID=A0ABU2HI36_9GAMM|nr:MULTISPECIES: 1-acyl-sn-glycerol-3-phosphate acyltransferase [unclassified Marinobacter]MBK1888268.1 1-acyl-sn-glycerol-3-phosphate acyltransferase [Marinobacter sp. DY40_1A1]MDS1310728.1 1-acyl-sn-glycerol-3-phosphate acyltransferase [Marinobacter sp. F60267]
MQEFDAIRPYSDEETGPAIQRLVNDHEFLDMVGRFKSPLLARWAPAPLRFFTRRWLSSRFGHFTKVDDLQAGLSGYIGELIESTTARVTTSGLENLSKQGAYLFISNHRDIVFDPMVVNYLLFHNDLRTTRIAIGDNLLANRVFAEMMRLNKSFIVRRDMTSPREMRDAYITLSGFINYSVASNENIWIAQREGRAKDGRDFTDPAIIKMFYMSCKKSGLSFAEAMNKLRIVPVSISYEYDPCDADKARELETKARSGSYKKAEGEDTEQIMKGLTQFKGHVHVHFGAPILDAPENAKELAAVIDTEVHANYRLHASNLIAYEMRGQNAEGAYSLDVVRESVVTAENWSEAEIQTARAEMERRLEACDPAIRPYLLDMYANPVQSALDANARLNAPE